jgi:hypothetical protein
MLDDQQDYHRDQIPPCLSAYPKTNNTNNTTLITSNLDLRGHRPDAPPVPSPPFPRKQFTPHDKNDAFLFLFGALGLT